MFVKWECGCKGIKLENTNWVIYSCDGEGDLSMYEREMTDTRSSTLRSSERKNYTEEELRQAIPKACTPLPQEEINDLLTKIGTLMHEGYKLHAIKSALR